MSKICAIVPTYNRAKYISECLNSLLSQTRPLDQIIVVNDGSSDNTDEVIAKYSDQITYLKKENGGKSSALNLAFTKTDADYIWVCDDDDYADPNALKAMMQALEQNPSAEYVFGTFKIFKEDPHGNRTYSDPYFWKRMEEPNLKINFLEMMFTYQFAMLIKRSAYDKAGAFNEDLVRSQDYDMTLRITRVCEGTEIPDIIFYQREHDGARGTGAAKFSAADKMKKWMEYDQKFFEYIAENYDLEEFSPSFAKDWNADMKRRATHLQRAMIMGKRALWGEVAKDIKAGLAASNAAITPQETNILEKIIRTQTAWMALKADRDSLHNLCKIYQGSGAGQQLILALFRPVIWLTKKSLKQKDLKQFLKYLCLMKGALGFRGTILRFWKSFRKA